MPKLRLKHASWALRLSGVLVFPALFIFQRSIIDDAIDVLSDANLGFLVAGTLLLLATSLVRAMRWRILAEAAGVRYPHFLDYLSIYYAGLFLGVAIPQIAASFAPVVLMSEDGHSWRRSSVSILFDRLLETVMILFVAFFAALYLLPDHHRLAVGVMVLSGGALAGGATLVWLSRFMPRLVARFEVGPLARLQKVTDALASDEARALYAGVRQRTSQLALLSVAVIVLQVAVVVLLAESLHIRASVPFLTAASAVVVLVVMLPISIAGLGSREATLVVLFTAVGEPREAAVALGILLFVVGIIARTPGAFGWWRRSTGAHRAETAHPVEVRAAVAD